MSLNATPTGERIHIGIFGRRNAGKSSLINAITGQELAIVSEVRGTTTDPVSKAMELLPLGPVVLIDTPGIDDEGELGMQRVKKARGVLNKTDIALLVIGGEEPTKEDIALLDDIKAKNIPYVVAYNKCDGFAYTERAYAENEIAVSARDGIHIKELRELIARTYRRDEEERRVIGDLLTEGDTVILVVPIDKAAPKGRLILPQQQTIRDILDANANALVIKENALTSTLAMLDQKPRMVVCDSQVFGRVSRETPKEIPLTSFSILMARYKGVLAQAVRGVTALERLKDGDKILISEGCTHHRQCGDIGTVKLPHWITEHTKKKLDFHFTSGGEFPTDVSQYALVVHCGGCMLNEREMRYRMRTADGQDIPMTNYGILIAYVHGILHRSVAPFDDIAALLP